MIEQKMTEEERAEESYIKYRNSKCKIIRNSENNHLHKDWRESGVDRHKAYTDGYLDGLAEGRKEGFYEGYKKATERSYERQQDLTDTYIKDGEKIKQLEKENEELKEEIESLSNINIKAQDIIAELKAQIESIKKTLTEISEYADEKPIHNIAQNELDKWEKAE